MKDASYTTKVTNTMRFVHYKLQKFYEIEKIGPEKSYS